MRSNKQARHWLRVLLLSALSLTLAACVQAATRSTPNSTLAIECGQNWTPPRLPAYPTGPTQNEASPARVRKYAAQQQEWAAVAIAAYRASAQHTSGVAACISGYNAALNHP